MTQSDIIKTAVYIIVSFSITILYMDVPEAEVAGTALRRDEQ
jgi:hypothetical protein